MDDEDPPKKRELRSIVVPGHRPSADQVEREARGGDKIEGPEPFPPDREELGLAGAHGAREMRIRYLMKLLAANRYGPEREEFVAKTLNISPHTLKRDISDARRRLQEFIANDDELRDEIHNCFITLREIGLDLALGKIRDANGKPVSHGNRIRAIEATAGVLDSLGALKGVVAPQKVDLTHGVSMEQLAEIRRIAKENEEGTVPVLTEGESDDSEGEPK